MALLQRGVIGELSGRIGGIEVARVGGRSVVKVCKGRQSKWSPARARAQASMAACKRLWDGYDPEVRLAWDVAARGHLVRDRFGTMRKQTGYQLRLSQWHDWTYCDVPGYINVPPISGPVPAVVNSVTLGPGFVLQVDCTTEHVLDHGWATAWVSRWCSLTSDARPSTFRWAGTIRDETPNYDWAAALTGENISFVDGERVYLILEFWSWGYYPHKIDYGFVTSGA